MIKEENLRYVRDIYLILLQSLIRIKLEKNGQFD